MKIFRITHTEQGKYNYEEFFANEEKADKRIVELATCSVKKAYLKINDIRKIVIEVKE